MVHTKGAGTVTVVMVMTELLPIKIIVVGHWMAGNKTHENFVFGMEHKCIQWLVGRIL